MELFYFGKPDRALFGAYHPPSETLRRNAGVVLCYPIGHEYIRAHRAFFHLATRLSEGGIHVLRFDYAGCGDSHDRPDPPDLGTWTDDVRAACQELRAGADVKRLCLIGLRVGASLAAMAAAQDGDLEALVLWDPVAEGRAHLREVRELHAQWLRGSFARPSRREPKPAVEEVLGFPLPRALERSLEDLDFHALNLGGARHSLVLDTQAEGSSAAVCRELRARGIEVEYRHVPSPSAWVKRKDAQGDAVVPVAVLEVVVSWVMQRLP